MPATFPVQTLGNGGAVWQGTIQEVRGNRICITCETAPAAAALVRLDLPEALLLGEVMDVDQTVTPAVVWIQLRYRLPH